MSNVKSFTVGTETYNVARASALQQDEVLSLMTQALIQRFVNAGQAGVEADESLIFAMMLSMPFAMKQKLDELLLSRVTKHGDSNSISARDFDGRVMELNRLRAKALMWNLEGFFTYWANEKSAAIESTQPVAPLTE